MTEDEFRKGPSVDEQVAIEAEAPLANVGAGVSAPTASTEETPVVTSVSESVAEIPLADSAIGLATTAIVGADAENQSPKDQEAANAVGTISPNAEDTSVAAPTGPVPVESAPVVGEVAPESDVAAGVPVAETTTPHEGFIERVVDEVECVLEAGVKEVESLIERIEESV